MTIEQKVIRAKVGLREFDKQLGNVLQARFASKPKGQSPTLVPALRDRCMRIVAKPEPFRSRISARAAHLTRGSSSTVAAEPADQRPAHGLFGPRTGVYRRGVQRRGRSAAGPARSAEAAAAQS